MKMAKKLIHEEVSQKDMEKIILKYSSCLSLDILREFLKNAHGIDASNEELAKVINDLIFLKKIVISAYVNSDDRLTALIIS